MAGFFPFSPTCYPFVLKRGSKPQTDLNPLTFLLPVKFCAKEITAPIFLVLPSLSGWQNREIHRAIPTSFSLIISLFSSPGLDRSQGKFPWVTSELSTCDCRGTDGYGQECVSAQVLRCCVAHDLIFGNLTLYLGSVCTVTYVIVMISLLTVTFLSNV